MANNQWQNGMVQGSIVEKVFQRPKEKMRGTPPECSFGIPNLQPLQEGQRTIHLPSDLGAGKWETNPNLGRLRPWRPPFEAKPESLAVESLDG